MRAKSKNDVDRNAGIMLRHAAVQTARMIQSGAMNRGGSSGAPAVTSSWAMADEDGNVYSAGVALTEIDSTNTQGVYTGSGDYQ